MHSGAGIRSSDPAVVTYPSRLFFLNDEINDGPGDRIGSVRRQDVAGNYMTAGVIRVADFNQLFLR